MASFNDVADMRSNYDPATLSGDDIIFGRTGVYDSYLLGYGGNDFFGVGYGNDYVDGGAGLDKAVIGGSIDIADITLQNGLVHISNFEGDKTFVNVERFYFNDVVLALDTSGNAGDAYRLYQAAFDRTPDQPGLSYWVQKIDFGMPLAQVALNFVLSAEFAATYGDVNTLSDAQFTTVLYQNVLNRAPDAQGFDYWMGELADGYPRHFMLTAFSQSDENRANVEIQIQGGIYLDTTAPI